jgi:hypothetical protein
MAKFCTKCGSPLTGPFCVKCGADMRQSATPAPPQPVQQNAGGGAPEAIPAPVAAMPPSATVPPLATNKKKMSPLAKLGIAAVVIIFVGGALAAGGLYYVAHRVSQKIHEEAGSILGSSSDSAGPDSSSGGTGPGNAGGIDACSLLSKEDVSRAIGVEIIRAQPVENGCSYIAKGTQADMMAKHTTAMAASRGADKKTQQMVQQFAGGMFKVFQSEDKDRTPDTGEIAVFNFSIDENAAEEQMRLNAKMLGSLGDTEGLPGIGDQAFVSADGMIMVRKGNKLVRIMFLTCPCGTEAVKPLAKKIADAL